MSAKIYGKTRLSGSTVLLIRTVYIRDIEDDEVENLLNEIKEFVADAFGATDIRIEIV